MLVLCGNHYEELLVGLEKLFLNMLLSLNNYSELSCCSPTKIRQLNYSSLDRNLKLPYHYSNGEKTKLIGLAKLPIKIDGC